MTWPVGVDDNDRQTVSREPGRHLLGLPFRALVMVAHLPRGDRSGFVRRADPAIDWFRQPDAAHRAGIDDPQAAGAGGGFDDVASAFDVRRVHGPVIAQPKVIARGNVKAPLAPLQRLPELRHVAQVSLDPLVLDVAQPPHVAPGPQKRLDPVFARDQLMYKVRTDETRGAGNEAVHGDNLERLWRAKKQKSKVRASPRGLRCWLCRGGLTRAGQRGWPEVVGAKKGGTA